MVDSADSELTRRHAGTLNLRVATEAKVQVRLDEQFRIDRAVRFVADRATFAHGFVWEDDRFCLLPMAFGTGLFGACTDQTTGGPEALQAVRVVTLDTLHLACGNRVPVWEAELDASLAVAPEACFRVSRRIYDELAPPSPH